MEAISAFDIFKIGVGPSSSHTMGPWRAAERFVAGLVESGTLEGVTAVEVDLYGSLAKTGKGHGTDIAVILGLAGFDPVTIDTGRIDGVIETIRSTAMLPIAGRKAVPFPLPGAIRFHFAVTLPFHPNGLTFRATLADGTTVSETYFSIGGGFIVQEGVDVSGPAGVMPLPYPIETAEQLLTYCRETGLSIAQVVAINERSWRTDAEVEAAIAAIWGTMRACIYRGSQTGGMLPGNLGVTRRAAALSKTLLGDVRPDGIDAWEAAVRQSGGGFRETLKWVSCFALAVNEENAAFGRVVTAPTNGAAGVIPAVLLQHLCFGGGKPEDVARFLLTAAEVGSLFKKGATLSAAMGGCQAEIGVSSAMAAAGLTECLGGTPQQVLMAAEIAMEHHLGLTCDPIGGLVQIPCIERNAMGAIKAITAAHLALEGDPTKAKVSLDAAIRSMWATALDMNTKYKETSEGGLAAQISVNLSEC